MVELSPQQMKIIERLFAAGFRPIAIPPYESALCLLVDGNLSVKLKRGLGEVFVWKKTEVEATPEKLTELESFRRELAEILDLPPKQ